MSELKGKEADKFGERMLKTEREIICRGDGGLKMGEFIEIPNYMKPNKDDNFNLVEIKNKTPHCKNHGAMNKFSNGIWRCLSEYGFEKQEDNTMQTFRDRTCCACCFELTMTHIHKKVMEILSNNSKLKELRK